MEKLVIESRVNYLPTQHLYNPHLQHFIHLLDLSFAKVVRYPLKLSSYKSVSGEVWYSLH